MQEINSNHQEELSPSERIHWKKDDPTKLDLEYHDRIGFIQKGVLYGAGATIGLAVIVTLVQLNAGNGDLALFQLIPSLLLGYLGIRGGVGIEKRKPNAIFLCKVYAWLCTGWNFIDIVASFATGAVPGFLVIALFIYGICILYAIYTSDDIKLVFPKEYRRITTSDFILALVCVGIDVVLLSLIILGLFMR